MVQLHPHSIGDARHAVVLSLLVWMVPAAAAAQGASPPKAAAPIQQPAPPAPPRPALPENYTYEADNRRDPFTTLLGTGAPNAGTIGSERANGPAGITTDELSVRGVMQSRGRLLAMIQGPDNKAYVVHAGDKLQDGVIKAVTTQGLVIVQEVNDPLSLVKQREVIKRLRSQEDAK